MNTEKLNWSAMTPRERDALIAERVMGWTKHPDEMDPTDNRTINGVLYCAPGCEGYNGGSAGRFNVVPHYTTDPADCAKVKEKAVSLEIYKGHGVWSVSFWLEPDEQFATAEQPTEELAVCLAALRAVGVLVD